MLDPELEREYEKRFGSASAKEAVRQVRLENRKSIRDSRVRIANAERTLQMRQAELEEARTIPGGEGMLSFFEATVKGCEKTLANLKADHARFVAQMALPTEGFPNGILFESFPYLICSHTDKTPRVISGL